LLLWCLKPWKTERKAGLKRVSVYAEIFMFIPWSNRVSGDGVYSNNDQRITHNLNGAVFAPTT
jgi:hypothetical protein